MGTGDGGRLNLHNHILRLKTFYNFLYEHLYRTWPYNVVWLQYIANDSGTFTGVDVSLIAQKSIAKIPLMRRRKKLISSTNWPFPPTYMIVPTSQSIISHRFQLVSLQSDFNNLIFCILVIEKKDIKWTRTSCVGHIARCL